MVKNETRTTQEASVVGRVEEYETAQAHEGHFGGVALRGPGDCLLNWGKVGQLWELGDDGRQGLHDIKVVELNSFQMNKTIFQFVTWSILKTELYESENLRPISCDWR
jgi:hypothetical protein